MAISKEVVPCKECARLYPGLCTRCYLRQAELTPLYGYVPNNDFDKAHEEGIESALNMNSKGHCGAQNCIECDEKFERKNYKHQEYKYAADHLDSYYGSGKPTIWSTTSATNKITLSPTGNISAMNTVADNTKESLKAEIIKSHAKVKNLLASISELEEYAQDVADTARGCRGDENNLKFITKNTHFTKVMEFMEDMVEHCKAALEENT